MVGLLVGGGLSDLEIFELEEEVLVLLSVLSHLRGVLFLGFQELGSELVVLGSELAVFLGL